MTTYTELRDGLAKLMDEMGLRPRPVFEDRSLGDTLITLDDGSRLEFNWRPRHISIASPDGYSLEAYYHDDRVIMSFNNGPDRFFEYVWHFLDPMAYTIEVKVGDIARTVGCNHNTLPTSILGLIREFEGKFGPSSRPLLRCAQWKMWSSDFDRELSRRMAACLPTAFISAIRRAASLNMIYNSVCFLAMVNLAFPSPDDAFWILVAIEYCAPMVA